MKVLSFIIPAYNSQKYLDKCLGSLLSKSIINDIEIIVVNDGSTDSTAEITSAYCKKYPETIKLISQENKGHGGALNTGCAAANGKYLKVIDADDWVETENLPVFIDSLRNCESDIVLTHHYTINESNGEIKKWKSYPEKFSTPLSFSYVVNNFNSFDRSLTFHGITYKTEFYHNHNHKLLEKVFYEDHEFSTFPCCFAKTVEVFDMFIYDYRIGDVSQSVSEGNQLKRLSHTEAVLNRFIEEYKDLINENETIKNFICYKAKILLLSYICTVLLVEKNKKQGRKLANATMELFKSEMPFVYNLTLKQYKVFRLMNIFHINSKMFEKLISSKTYRKLKGTHDFN